MSTPAQPLVASGSQTIGPFFHVGPGATDHLGTLAAAGTAGERIRVRVQVLDGDDVPVPDALIEIWQADGSGVYSAIVGPEAPAFAGFGRLSTGEDGSCAFETIKPGRVAGADGALQAAHVNVIVFARGLLRHLYTRLYFAGDPALADDALLGLVPAERRDTLIARRAGDATTWTFVISLQGPRETVFFDL
jgi:protocatechuate 3,4-dioxygenase, alpha subunit